MKKPPSAVDARISDMIRPRALPFSLEGPPVPRPTDTETAAQYFRAARKALGLTVAGLSAILRAKPRTLNGWEGGRTLMDPTAWLTVQALLRFPALRKWAAVDASAPSRRRRIL